MFDDVLDNGFGFEVEEDEEDLCDEDDTHVFNGDEEAYAEMWHGEQEYPF